MNLCSCVYSGPDNVSCQCYVICDLDAFVFAQQYFEARETWTGVGGGGGEGASPVA